MNHELKCWPEFFEAISRGEKKHELRRADDRDFKVGDVISLKEWEPKAGLYTGREMSVLITYITSAQSICAFSPEALDRKFCIMSISPTTH